jgi:hypothetical protein
MIGHIRGLDGVINYAYTILEGNILRNVHLKTQKEVG